LGPEVVDGNHRKKVPESVRGERGRLVPQSIRKEVLGYVDEAIAKGISERRTCKYLELNRKTIQNWRRHEGTTDKRKGSDRFVKHRLAALEEETFYDAANSPRFRDHTPEQIVATLAEEGIYYASASTLYRILRKRKAVQHRLETKKPTKNTKAVPILVTGPNQVWAWDITWLKTDVVGLFKYGYNIIDLYDRVIVGWAIEDTESDDHARRLFERVIRDQQVVPQIIHADNGGPMRGVSLGAFLDKLCVTRSHSRPRCSNDNAFIESWHKTLKHTVGYPAFFTCLEHARTWYADFVAWYNNDHLHASLDYVTPYQRRTGEALDIYRKRNQTILAAKEKNPSRWRTGKVRTYDAMPVSMSCRPLSKVA